MVNTITRVVRVCNENVELAGEGVLRVRLLPSYHLSHPDEMFTVSSHSVNEDLLTGVYLRFGLERCETH